MILEAELNTTSQIADILSVKRTEYQLEVASKKKLMQWIAHQISKDTNMDETNLFMALIHREKLGSTALENGVAIPHCQFEDCKKPIGVFAHLKTPIDFNAIDQQLTDIVFALVIPTNFHQEHLKILQKLAICFSTEHMLDKIRNAKSNSQLYYEMINLSQ